MTTFLELIFRVFLISFTEQLVIVLIAARLLKSYDFLRNKSELVFATLIPALLSYIPIALNISKSLKMVLGIFVTTCFIALVTKTKFSKVLVYVLVSFALFLATEFLCVTIIIYSTGITTTMIDSNLFYSTVVAIFERLIQATILYLFYVKEKNKLYKKVEVNIDVFDIIINSKRKRTLAIIVLASIVVFFVFIGRAFMFNKILQDLSPIYSISICILSVLLPVVSVYSFLENIYNDYVNNEIYFKYISANIKDKCIHAIECAKKTGDLQTIEAIMKIYKPLE